MWRTFRHANNWATWLFVSLVWFFFALYGPTLPLAFTVARDGTLPFGKTLHLMQQILESAASDASVLFIAYAAATAILTGLNIVLLIFYIRLFRAAPSISIGGGLLGIISALLGFSCAACGSVFLSAFSATLASSIISLIPLGEVGLQITSIALLIFSAYILVRAINKPPVCPI